MNNLHLRSFSIGMMLATFVFSYIHFFHSGEIEINQKGLKNYLAQNELTLVKNKEYEHLVKMKQKAEEYESKVKDDKEEEETTDNKETTSTDILFYDLVINEGMYSSDISKLLFEAGIIKDATEFNQYLIDNNLQDKVQIGTYEVTNEMSYEEIAELIT
ncbi:endolytic transglycosylase MltG [Bacillus timonensis]|nr:endolytic transglycosylase MltG [Bacillus timonensis]